VNERHLDLPSVATAVALGAAAAVHFAWARGSTWPRESEDELADLVVGKRPMPPPAASAAVAAALTGAAAAVLVGVHTKADSTIGNAARLATKIASRTLRTRGIGGLVMARAGMATSGDATEEFRRLDQTFYSPLCLALSVGTARSARLSAERSEAAEKSLS
jgi:hypothetical protein